VTLKAVVETIDSVPEAVRGMYAEKDGKFHLQVEGMVSADKLSEFRDNNIKLLRERDELTKRFEGIDPDAVKALQDQAKKIKEGELIAAGKIEDLFAERLAPVKQDYESKLTAAQKDAAEAKAHLEKLLIDGAIRDAAMKAGVRATAVDDVLLRGRATFKVVDGKAVPMDGEKPVYGKNGDVMLVDEWIVGLAERAPHLFEPSQGGGAAAGRPSLSGGGAGRVAAGDHKAFIANLSKIAKREVLVTG